MLCCKVYGLELVFDILLIEIYNAVVYNYKKVGKLLGMSSSMVSVARSFGPIAAGLLQEVSFAIPAYFATFISIIGLWVFHSNVYCLKRSQE